MKTIFLTGATDGIGFETARTLAAQGHQLLLHGRSLEKLAQVQQTLSTISPDTPHETYTADLSELTQVADLAQSITSKHHHLDALINNAGVFTTAHPIAVSGLDIRFLVNTIAPYLLTKKLLPILNSSSRVINLSSAAQASVDLDALVGKRHLSDGEAYAQSKFAITAWSIHLAAILGEQGPAIIPINPGSFLGSKMVKQAYGQEGKDLRIGADILTRATLDLEFAEASGQYFDNDSGQFALPHPDALDPQKTLSLIQTLDSLIDPLSP